MGSFGGGFGGSITAITDGMWPFSITHSLRNGRFNNAGTRTWNVLYSRSTLTTPNSKVVSEIQQKACLHMTAPSIYQHANANIEIPVGTSKPERIKSRVIEYGRRRATYAINGSVSMD